MSKFKIAYFPAVIKKNILVIGLILAFLVNLLVGILSYYNISKLYETDILEKISYQKIINIEELFSYLKDTETARRGYILTGEDHFLGVYREALPLIEQSKKFLQLKMINQVDQQELSAVLENKINEKLSILKLSIESMTKEGYNKDRQSQFTTQGKDVMDQIRNIMNGMIKREKDILNKWSFENETSKRKTALIITSGYSLSFLIIFFIFLELSHQISIRRKSEDSLKQALKVKSDFTAMVSHELRTPLTAIKEGIGIVFDGSAGAINEEQRDFLDTAKRNVDRLARLIDNVLDFQKLEYKKMILT